MDPYDPNFSESAADGNFMVQDAEYHPTYTLRSRSPRKPHKRSTLQKRNQLILRNVMWAYHWTLTDAERLSWQSGTKDRQNRSGAHVDLRGQDKWLQCNMANAIAGYPLIITQEQRSGLAITDVNFYLADSELQQLFVAITLNATVGTHVEFDIHLSMIPAAYIGSTTAWRYAKWTASSTVDIESVIASPIVYDYNYDSTIPFKKGEKIGLFVRVVLHRNDSPPTTKQESRETTESWLPLVVVAE